MIPDTVTVPTSVVIEALAGIAGLADFEATLAGFQAGEDSEVDTAAGEWAAKLRGRLQDTIFGLPPEGWGDGAFPAEVAITSQASEICADLIEAHLKHEAETNPMIDWARRIRKHAQLMREAGTVNVMLPN